MFDQVNASSSGSWEDTQPDTHASVANWRQGNSAYRPKRISRRTQWLIGSVVTLAMLTGMLTWATTSIGTAPHIAVTLAGSDYRTNLGLPPNGFGDRAIGRLAAWATEAPTSSRRDVRLAVPPIELATPVDLNRLEPDSQADIALIYITAHGISTPRGPGLLPANSQSVQDAVMFREILAKVQAFPEHQKKILLLDCVHSLSIPSCGILHNDFARQVRELSDAIESIPNLVVIVSANVNEVSLAHPADGTTQWASAMVSALNGAANDLEHDGWIDLGDVFRHSHDQTQRWANTFYGQPQSSLLLPQGQTGIDRCKTIQLYPSKTAAVEIPSFVASTRSEDLARWWERHELASSRPVHPCVTAPWTWYQLEKTILRYEHFELAGCRDAADECATQLETLFAKIDKRTTLDSIACRAGVIPAETVGYHPPSTLSEAADRLLIEMKEVPLDEAADLWLGEVAAAPDAEYVGSLRRLIAEKLTIAMATDLHSESGVDRQRLSRAAAIMRAITNPLQPPPQSLVLVELLDRDLPPGQLDSHDATRIARWLELSLRSDRVANHHPWWSKEVYPWVNEQIVKSDRARRLAGDLLAGDRDARAKADDFLIQAEAGYAESDKIAECVIEALEACAVGRYQLDHLRSVLMARLSSRSGSLNPNTIDSIDPLYRCLDRIDEALELGRSSSPVDRIAHLKLLATETAEFNRQITPLRDAVTAWQAETLNGQPERLCEPLAALACIGSTSQSRLHAWNQLVRCSAKPLQEAATNDIVATPSENTVHDAWIMRRAALCGKLSVAPWPDAQFKPSQTETLESKPQWLHRLDLLPAESAWWHSLATASAQLDQHIAAIFATDRSHSDELHWAKPIVNELPVAMRRQFTRHSEQAFAGYLNWQADRFFADGYWSADTSNSPYYQQVVQLLRSDAISLDPDITASNEQDPNHNEVEIVAPSEMVWTTQSEDSIDVSVTSAANAHEGFVTLWSTSKGSIQLAQPLEAQRSCRSLNSPHTPPDPTSTAISNALVLTLERDPAAPATTSVLDVYGYFRGRQLHHSIPLKLASQADQVVIHSPAPSGGRISVRSTENSTSGDGGAITLVVDCSGSMGAPRGQEFGPDTKYARAVDAISTLLESLPPGTQLSVWVFGQATGAEKTVTPAERTIRRIQAPIAWDPDDKSMRENILASLSYPHVEPWNESPLLAAMIAASSDLRDAQGLRTLVAITDGGDNRVANDHVANPLGLAPEELIKRHFQGSGITVNVIGFQVDRADKEATRRQLSVVSQLLPAGRFVQVEQTAELVQAMREMMMVPAMIQVRRVQTAKRESATETISLPVTLPGAAPKWTPVIAPGLYHVRTNDRLVESVLQVQDGDHLMLERSSLGEIRPWPLIARDYSWCQQQRTGRWTLAMIPTPASQSNQSRRTLVFSTEATTNDLIVQRPGEVWIEATHDNKAFPIQLERNHQLPAYALSLSIACADGIEPEVRVWLCDRPASPVGSLVHDRDFHSLADLPAAKWIVNTDEIVLRSARIESHEVADRNGKLSKQSCLVLRATCPPGRHYRLRTEGIAVDGQDEQCFTELGQLTLRQWPVTESELNRSLKAIHLVSVDQFKLEAEQRNGSVVFSSLPAGPVSTDRLSTSVQAERGTR